jgi:hypothetical protein
LNCDDGPDAHDLPTDDLPLSDAVVDAILTTAIPTTPEQYERIRQLFEKKKADD